MSPKFRNKASHGKRYGSCIISGLLVGILMPSTHAQSTQSQTNSRAMPPALSTAPSIASTVATSHAPTITYIEVTADARYGLAILEGDNITVVHGNDDDYTRIKQLPNAKDHIWWYRRAGKTYLITDEATVKHALDIYSQLFYVLDEQKRLDALEKRLSLQQHDVDVRWNLIDRQQAMEVQHYEVLRMQEEVMRRNASSPGQANAISQSVQAQMNLQIPQAYAIANEAAAADLAQGELLEKKSLLWDQKTALSKQREQLSEQLDQQLNKLLEEALAKGLAEVIQR